MYVLTIDQRGSRTAPDRVDALLALLNGPRHADGRVLSFERTAGDEAQGVMSQPLSVVTATLAVMEQSTWSVGIGLGPVRRPLPDSTRAASGAAFENAREAVVAAKSRADHLAVRGTDTDRATHAEAVLLLLAAVAARRSPRGVEAVQLMRDGLTQNEAAVRLSVTKQAVSQRLHAAWWHHENATVPVAAALLAAADRQ